MTTYDARIIADGAQAYWKLDEAAVPGTLADSTANGLPLTVNNGSVVDGWQVPGIPIQGLASAVDGTATAGGMYGSSPSASFQLTPGQSFSFEIWMGGVGAAGSQIGLFTRGYATPGQDSRPWYLLEIDTDGTVNWWLRSGAGTDYKVASRSKVYDATYVTRGPWHHLVGTYDHSTTTMALYVDGVLQGTVTAPDTGWGTNGGPFALGRFNGISSGLWMTCAAFYLRALSASDAMAHYELGRNGVSWYPYQQSQDYSQIQSGLTSLQGALSAVQTSLNRALPPLLGLSSRYYTDLISGTGSLVIHDRIVSVTMDYVPSGWGYVLGYSNIFENRLAQLVFVAPLLDGSELVTLMYEQHEDTRTFIFSDTVPTKLYYDVAPGAGIVVQQYDL